MRRIQFVLVVALACAAGGSAAQGWVPQKNVEIVVGSAPGGSNDKTARTMERILVAYKLLPVSLTVVNRPGGSSSIAYTYVNQRPGDPHFLYVASSTVLGNHIVGTSQLSHADFTLVASLYNDYAVFAVQTGSPIKTGRELADRLKKDPRSLSVGFANAYGSRHVASLLLLKTLGGNARDLKSVVFKGSAEAITALLGGHIDVVCAGAGNTVAHVAAGTMRVIAVAAPTRLPGPLAGTPTLKEQGVDMVYGNWRGIFAPKGLTPAQLAFWEGTLRRMVESPEWKADLERNYWTEEFLTGARLAKEIEQDYAHLKTLLTEVGFAK